MKTIIVRYKLKPGCVDDNEALVRGVFDQLQQRLPAGLRYASFKLADGLSFVHLAQVDTADGSNPLPALPAFQAFVAQIRDRCDEPPVASDAQEIGTYGMG